MFEMNISDIENLAGQFLWPLFRIAGFFMSVPIIGANVVPMRIRLMFTLLVTIVVVPNLPELPAFSGLSAAAFLIIAQQLLIGVLLGFLFHIFFQIFILTGQITAMQMGLGFASMVDPTNGVSVAVVSQLYLIMITLFFVLTNGHLVMIEVMIESFRTMPIGLIGLSSDHLWTLVNLGSWMFASALLLALPAATALLIVNMSFGIMSRAAPQLNIFALGFPVALLTGLTLLWIISSSLLPKFNNLAEQTFALMRQFITPL